MISIIRACVQTRWHPPKTSNGQGEGIVETTNILNDGGESYSSTLSCGSGIRIPAGSPFKSAQDNLLGTLSLSNNPTIPLPSA
jgi:hypothetical protein